MPSSSLAKSNSIVHLTSVHPKFDTRIFHKECKALMAAGYNVILVVPADRDEIVDGICIHAVTVPRNRLKRMTLTAVSVCSVALKLDASLYHFHDPELITVGLLLRLFGKNVIYDIHEDYRTSILQKKYLPIFLRRILSSMFSAFEFCCSRFFNLVLAERYYAKNFPKGLIVANYPILPADFDPTSNKNRPCSHKVNLIYTGNISEERGALLHSEIVRTLDDTHLYMIGKCDKNLSDRILRRASNSKERIHIVGEGYHVPYSTILDYYNRGIWTAGLAIFPPSPHYLQKELTKFFEYMAFGIPVICSDFPIWRSLIQDNGVGLCVDPNDVNSALDAIRYLFGHPNEAVEMGMRGKRLAFEKFNWNIESQKLLFFYKQILSQ